MGGCPMGGAGKTGKAGLAGGYFDLPALVPGVAE